MRCAAVFLALLMTVTTNLAQECLYQYVQQPLTSLSCNPHGSELQLHCGFIGPLSPSLTLQWYLTTPETLGDLTPLSLTPDLYHIKNVVLDMTMGVPMRSISSVLQMGPVGDDQSDLCFLCRAEISGLAIPVSSNRLCIREPSYYNGLPLCSDPPSSSMVNTTQQCVLMPESFLEQLQQLMATPSPTMTPVHINTDSTSIQSLHTSPPIAMATTHTVTPTPSAVKPTGRVDNNDDKEMSQSPSSFEAGLYAAIVVCAVFVIVIAVLVLVIVCLSRRKGRCLKWRVNSQSAGSKNNRSRETGVGVGNRAFMVGSELQSLVESGVHSIGGTFQHDDIIDGPRLIKAGLHNEMPTQQILNKQSLPRATEKTESEPPRPPNLPPKPGKAGPSKKGHSANYDHLELADDSKRSKRSPERTHKEPSSTFEGSLPRNSELPPRKPPRSRSRDHFYHTLESSDDSGLLRSANTSHHSSRMSYQLSLPDGGEEGQRYSHRSSGLSEQLRELFDDPRYAVLFVNMREEKRLGD